MLQAGKIRTTSRGSEWTGFTLLELLVVLIIFAIAFGLFLGYNYRQQESVQLKATGREVFQLLQTAKSYALLDGRKNACYYDPSDHIVFESLRQNTLSLPSHIAIDKAPKTEEEKALLATFYPDGSAISDGITLQSGEEEVYLSIDPFLGKVQMQWAE